MYLGEQLISLILVVGVLLTCSGGLQSGLTPNRRGGLTKAFIGSAIILYGVASIENWHLFGL